MKNIILPIKAEIDYLNKNEHQIYCVGNWVQTRIEGVMSVAIAYVPVGLLKEMGDSRNHGYTELRRSPKGGIKELWKNGITEASSIVADKRIYESTEVEADGIQEDVLF